MISTIGRAIKRGSGTGGAATGASRPAGAAAELAVAGPVVLEGGELAPPVSIVVGLELVGVHPVAAKHLQQYVRRVAVAVQSVSGDEEVDKQPERLLEDVVGYLGVMVIALIRDVAAEHVVHALDGPSGDEATVEPFLGGAAQHCHHVGVKRALACGGPPDTPSMSS